MKIGFLLFTAIIALICGGTAFGTLWNVDFESDDNYTYKEQAVGPGPDGGVGDPCDYWNVFEVHEDGTVDPCMLLLDSAEGSSGVMLSFTVDGTRLLGAWGHSPDAVNAVVGEYLFLGDQNGAYNADFTISGLVPSGAYDIYLYGGGPTFGSYLGQGLNCDITIDTDGDGNLADETAVTIAEQAAPTVISGIFADGSGSILGLFADNGGLESEWAGFQLNEAFEPIVAVVQTDGSTEVAEEGETSDTFTVELVSVPSDVVTITLDPETNDIKLDSQSAGAAVDLVFTMSDWDTPQTVTVSANDDTIEEGAESVKIILSSVSVDSDFDNKPMAPINVRVADNDVVGMIVNESGGSTDVGEEGETSDAYTVVLGAPPTGNVTVNIADVSEPDEVTIAPAELVFSTGNWATPRTVSITAVDDSIAEVNPHLVTVSHTAMSGDSRYEGLVENVSVTVSDNDSAVLGFALELIDSNMIWDQGAYNSFTDLIRFKDEWFCTFREGGGHTSDDGKARIIRSTDGDTWTSAALILCPAPYNSLYDPKLCITALGDLMLTATHWASGGISQSYVWSSSDGVNWSSATPIGLFGEWLWRTEWHNGVAYIFARDESNYPSVAGTYLQLYKSTDGTTFSTHGPKYFENTYPNETSFVFLEDDTCWVLLRRDLGGGTTAQLGLADPPYDSFTWQDLGVQIGGPEMIQMPNGRFLAAVRLYDGGARTALCWVNHLEGTLTELLALPSGGDTSYAGMVLYDNILWVSYYSSHEGTKARIYLAKVRYTSTLNAGDIDVDGDVDMEDFGWLGKSWQGLYGMEDLANVALYWLEGVGQ